jgi:hypothetical protein
MSESVAPLIGREQGTHEVRLDTGGAHPAAHVRVDRQRERLDEEAAVEGHVLEVDRLGRIRDRVHLGLGEAWRHVC